MAKLRLFQLFDLNAGLSTGPIMIERNAGPALRMFYSILGNKETTVGMYPEDFNLMELGTQNDETGEIEACKPELIASGREWAREQQETAGTARSGAATLSGSDIPRQVLAIEPETLNGKVRL